MNFNMKIKNQSELCICILPILPDVTSSKQTLQLSYFHDECGIIVNRLSLSFPVFLLNTVYKLDNLYIGISVAQTKDK